MPTAQHAVVLMADDDVDDCRLVQEAFQEIQPNAQLHFARDGEALMDYLQRCRREGDAGGAVLPRLILLDLNMPRKHGYEALQEIREDPALRHIPVVVLTTSDVHEDVLHSYRLGANSYIVKPTTFAALLEALRALTHYWFETVELP